MKNCVFLLLLMISTSIFSQESEKESGWYLIKAKDATSKYLDITDDYSIEDNLITIKHVKSIQLIASQTRPFKQIQLNFTEEGKQIWEEQTDKFSREKVCFIFENQVVAIVTITVKISSGSVSFSSENPKINTDELYNKLKPIVENQK
jgi:preprotein translocase subunit SecD